MKATEEHFLKFVRGASQFIIPIYQLKYSWGRKNCEQLWKDIILAGEEKISKGHFIGSIVYVAENPSHNSPLLVIDGQQRLTTFTLLIVALSRSIGEDEPFEDFSQQKLENRYLIQSDEKGDKRRRLVLSETDRDILFAIIEGRESDFGDDYSHRILDNFKFFQKRIAKSKDSIEVICRGLSKLLIVDVALSRETDNPQLVFESMNSKGHDLSQADLIRNYMLMGLDTDTQERLYKTYWQRMERDFGQESDNEHFNKFMRHYLTVKMSGEIPRVAEVYEVFKNFSHREERKMEDIVQEIRQFSQYYCAIALGKETNMDLKKAFNEFVGLQMNVAYPLLLELYSYYDNNTLNQEDFSAAVYLIESYIFRRAACNIPTNSLNKTFATFGKALDKEGYLESMIDHFLSLPSYKRFPDDEEFKDEIKKRDLYNFKMRKYWMGRLENFNHKEKTSVDNYTIEHIMPQKLTDEWKDALGEHQGEIYKKYLHTIGNLTLTGYNPEYSNRSFKEKRDMEKGFNQSRFYMNEGLGELDDWDEKAIRERADRLADRAVQVWAYPERKS